MQDKPKIDQDALSRQLAVYGHEAQGKLMALRVFIHGLSGLSLEVAKNLILAGPKQVTLFDKTVVSVRDLSRNFYVRPEDVGKNARDQASLTSLKELNSNCQVTVAEKDDIDFIIKNYDCVVAIDNYDKEYLIKLNKECHKNKIGFIAAGNLGLYGYTFVDYGEAHRILDATGEEPKSIHIAGITQQAQGLVCLHQQKKHGLDDGDVVQFKQIKGMTQLNDKEYPIKVISPHSFTIGDTTKFSAYTTGGMCLNVKVPIVQQYHDFEKSLRYPYPPDSKEMPIASWQKFGVPEQLHVILNAVYSFYQKHKHIPRSLNAADHEEVVALVKQYQNNKMEVEGEDFKVEEINPDLIRNVCYYGEAQISACSSFWGGVVAQEIVKLIGKYSPLRQWLHHQFFEVLPEEGTKRTLQENQYYDYHLLFGDDFVKKCHNSSSFIIGAGALGCEFIKMFALMGASSQSGEVAVTDDDCIEISNLNRQFLFRREHVKANKSQTACHVGNLMNKNVKFQPHKLRVGEQSEEIFNDEFWTNRTFVVNAVDNVKARQFVDRQCVWYEKPLFESGTLGTKCHSQIIIPHATLTYTDLIDPPEESIPLCTLKNFPYQIEHTIQWARDYFEGEFADPSSELSNFYSNGADFLAKLKKQHRQNPSMLKSKLQRLYQLYKVNESRSYASCVELSCLIFQDVFNHQIHQLLHAFPADHVIEETGKLFWSGLKKVPLPLELNLKDPIHLDLVQAGANIFATMFNIEMCRDKNKVIELAEQVKLPKFIAKNVKIITDQNQKEQEPALVNQDDERDAEQLIETLSKIKVDPSKSSTVVEFEKDEPTNFHIEFMGAVSNLRARNYKIQEVDNFKVKLIAGKIIPAIATTTAMVVGAVGIEIIKYLLGKKGDSFKNITSNLALPLWVFNDPQEPIVLEDKEMDIVMGGPIKAIPGKFTKWDKIDEKGPMTVGELTKHFEKKFDIEVSMITFGTATVWSAYGDKSREGMSVPEAIEQVTKKKLPAWKKFLPLGVSGNTKDGIDCILPDVRYQV